MRRPRYNRITNHIAFARNPSVKRYASNRLCKSRANMPTKFIVATVHTHQITDVSCIYPERSSLSQLGSIVARA